MSTVRHESKPVPSQQLNYLTSFVFPLRLSFERFLLHHSGSVCCLQEVSKFLVHRHLRYQYPTIPKYCCPQGVNRCSHGESYHFFWETCCLCRQGKVLLPLQCSYLVPVRPRVLLPSAPQIVASQNVVNDTFAAIRSSDLNTIDVHSHCPTLAIFRFRMIGANLILCKTKLSIGLVGYKEYFCVQLSLVEIQTPMYCEPMGRSMTALHPMFSAIRYIEGGFLISFNL